MVRRPWSRDADLAVFEMPRRRAIAVLVLGDGSGVDEVGEIDKHPAGVSALADHVLLERRKQLVDLHGEGAGLGLPLSRSGRLLPQLPKVLASHTIGRINYCFLQRAVFNDKLEVHLSFPPQTGDAFKECLAIGFHRPSERIV